MKDYRIYELTKLEKKIFYVGLVLASVILAMLFYRTPVFAVILIPFSKRIQKFVTDMMLERNRRALLEQFKDFLFLAATSVGAGRGMKEAIKESIPRIEDIYGEDCILAAELKDIHKRLELGNEDDVDVLADFAGRSGIEDIIDFVMIYSICKKTGASLILAMNKAASVIIDKMTIENEIRELARRKKNEGMFIFAVPVVVIVFLNMCAPDYIDPLYSSMQGRLIMTFVVVANICIYGMVQRIVKVDI